MSELNDVKSNLRRAVADLRLAADFALRRTQETGGWQRTRNHTAADALRRAIEQIQHAEEELW